MAKAKSYKMVTPVAPCMYPFLNKPNTKWNPSGVYKVDLIFDQDDPFVAELEANAQEAFEDAKDNMKPAQAKRVEYVSPVKPIVDEETGEETGDVKLSFKRNVISKFKGKTIKNTITIVDSKAQVIKDVPSIGNGSTLSVAFNASPAVVQGKFYLSLWMNAVQLVDLVEYAVGADAFSAHDSGYTAPEKSDVPFDTDDDDSGEPSDW